MKKLTEKSYAWLLGLSVVRAQTLEEPPENVADINSFIKAIDLIAKWMYNILLALGVVFVLYAAFLYMISQGNEERMERAKKVLIYAIVALVIAVLAGGISSVVEDFITDVG